MLIPIGLYVFNVVCAARLAIELPSSASDAVLCSVLVVRCGSSNQIDKIYIYIYV